VSVCGVAFIVGVDGGASKTVALIATDSGKIVGRGQSGSSNYQNVGAAAAREAMSSAVDMALKMAHMTRKQLTIAVVALAGMDSNSDVTEVRRFTRVANLADQSFVTHDSISALYAATEGGPGIIVNSGTGSFAAGVNERGQYARAGGWGYLIGDEGSAFDIGRKVLALSFRMLDGRAKPTKLQNIVRRRFRVTSLEDAMALIYPPKVDDIALLSPIVSRLASSDKTCRRILGSAGFELGELGCAVARRLEMTQNAFPIATMGGGFKSGRYLMRPFFRRIKAECPRARISFLSTEPVRGALMIALCILQEQKHATVNKLVNLNSVIHHV